MTSFEGRLAQAASLEVPFIETFNAACDTHKVVKFGIESTRLQEIHPYIRSADDTTSHFVRYLPDSAIVRTAGASGRHQICLIEFKVSDTLIYSDRFFNNTIRATYGDQQPPLVDKQDIFETERDALSLYRRITGMGVAVAVVAYQSPRTKDTQLIRAQYAQNIVVCHEYTPGRGGGGSGTPMSNTHFDSFIPIAQFFEQEFGIQPNVLDTVVRAVLARGTQ